MLVMTKPVLALTAKDLMNGEVIRVPRDMGMQAAARWLEQASLPAATKTSLLAELQKQRP